MCEARIRGGVLAEVWFCAVRSVVIVSIVLCLAASIARAQTAPDPDALAGALRAETVVSPAELAARFDLEREALLPIAPPSPDLVFWARLDTVVPFDPKGFPGKALKELASESEGLR